MNVYTTKRFEFSASHRYWNPNWSESRNREVFGKTTGRFGHGHNYVLEVTVTGLVDADTGMVINITDLKRIVAAILDAEFDHKHLNEDTPYFREQQPTTENVSRVLWQRIAPALPKGIQLARIRLYEDPTLYAEVYGEDGGAALARVYGFSAAHRLHTPALSDAQNRALYGKCDNPHGHGHNYVFEAVVAGPVDPDTGMVVPPTELDGIAGGLAAELDGVHLDAEVSAFRAMVSTGENIVAYLWRSLYAAFGERLRRVKLWETPNNTFEVSSSD
jgi:6-pyruvoyltetrahydropterin/6-carboxytetrahydropterin synthase